MQFPNLYSSPNTIRKIKSHVPRVCHIELIAIISVPFHSPQQSISNTLSLSFLSFKMSRCSVFHTSLNEVKAVSPTKLFLLLLYFLFQQLPSADCFGLWQFLCTNKIKAVNHGGNINITDYSRRLQPIRSLM